MIHRNKKRSERIPSPRQISQFRRRLLKWFAREGRVFPWRQTKNPWHVLVSEVMLQRTRADQVATIYNVVLKTYPTPHSVATSPLRRLRKSLRSLGLPDRVGRFRDLARSIEKDFAGEIPSTRDELTSLPGVGDYIAGAVLSLAQNRKAWIVDVNVVRLFGLYFGVSTAGEARRQKHMIELAGKYANTPAHKKSNWAMLDFAAVICTARNPACSLCPVASNCRSAYPGKNGKR
jgi:A/G-specific adenine glycosylase